MRAPGRTRGWTWPVAPVQGRGAPHAVPHPQWGLGTLGSDTLAGGRFPGASKDPPPQPLWARGARSNSVETRPGSGSGSERGAESVPRSGCARPPRTTPPKGGRRRHTACGCGPELKMAGQHSPVTPPPSPPPRSASRAVRCRPRLQSHAARGTDADAQVPESPPRRGPKTRQPNAPHFRRRKSPPRLCPTPEIPPAIFHAQARGEVPPPPRGWHHRKSRPPKEVPPAARGGGDPQVGRGGPQVGRGGDKYTAGHRDHPVLALRCRRPI